MSRLPIEAHPRQPKGEEVFTQLKLALTAPEVRGILHVEGTPIAQVDAGMTMALARRTNKTMDMQVQLRAMRVLCMCTGADSIDAGSLKDDVPLTVEYVYAHTHYTSFDQQSLRYANYATPFAGGYEAKLRITSGTVYLHTLPFFIMRLKDWALHFVSVMDKSKIITGDPHSKSTHVSDRFNPRLHFCQQSCN